MTFRRGPVFANLVLADEINRAAPKTQSALLEAMAEQHVTVGGADLSAGRAVPGRRHAEPDRAGRDVSAARGAARPVHDGDPSRLPDAAAGRGDRHDDQRSRPPQAARGGIRSRGISGSCATWSGPYRCRKWSRPTPCGSAASRPTDDGPHVYQGLRRLGGRAARQSEPGAAPPRPRRCWRAGPRPPSTTCAVAVPVLRHRVLPNHRAIGDGVDRRRRSSSIC